MLAKLNLGSYVYPLEGYWNVDLLKWPGVDQIANLNRLPWPWPDNYWEEVRALDIVEHLGKLTKVEIFSELERITKPGGTVLVRVPDLHHTLALASLQHAHAFTLNSMEESYAQPWFGVMSIDAVLPHRFPYRELNRIICRLGLCQTITFTLEKRRWPVIYTMER